MKPTIAVLGLRVPSLDVEEAVLRDLGASLVRALGASASEVIEAARQADVVLAGSLPKFPAAVLEALPQLKAIVRFGIGVDNIDLRAAHAKGIMVANVPDYCIPEVATHAATLILAAARRLFPANQSAREGRWDVASVRPLPECEAQTVGLVGFGRIGQEVAARLRPFGFQISAADPASTWEAAHGLGVDLVDLESLLGAANIISLHAPLTKATRHLISGQTLAKMQPNAYIVNTARGGLIDETALKQALDDGRLGGALLDVLDVEPPPENHPLVRHPRVVITPHVAWYSERAAIEMRRKAAEEARRFLRGEILLHPVGPTED